MLFRKNTVPLNVPVRAVVTALLLALAGCGGGGSDDGDGVFRDPGNPGSAPPGGNGSYTAGVFQPASAFGGKCAAPRSGTDPITGVAYTDVAGTATDENNWLRSMSHDLYLWYTEIPDRNPGLTADPLDYFDLLKTSAVTASDQPKDKFHFTYDTQVWESLSQLGVEASYGVQFALLSALPPRKAVVAFVEPNAPSDTVNAGIVRGLEVITVDGQDVATTDNVDALNAGMFPEAAGQPHDFVFKDLNGVTFSATLTSADVTSTPVQNVHTIATGTGAVGYMLFNDHIATAEGALKDAITTLQTAGITDLVLDIRYNGGGLLDVAGELAFMIAGPTATAGKTFEKLEFNDQHPTTDPVTGEALAPTPFHDTSQGFTTGLPSGTALPSLNLARVFVLTGNGTCSASESIINSLRGVDVEVIQIGSTTCGKPYGFYPLDNCGTTYFTIQFRGVNDKDFGDYTDGFSPQNSTGIVGTTLPGCSVADDFSHELGDPLEGRLAAALDYRTNASCSGPATGNVKTLALRASRGDVIVPKSAFRENRILRH